MMKTKMMRIWRRLTSRTNSESYNEVKGLRNVAESTRPYLTLENTVPYGGTTPEQDKKIERCVSNLMANGKSKDSAIAICKSSVLGTHKRFKKNGG